MHSKYPNVFSPIQLGPVKLNNRFYMSPHSVPMAVGCKPSDDYVHYNVARVKGGCGLIFISMALLARARTFQPSSQLDDSVAAFRVLTAAVHAAGGKVFGEPYYHWAVPGQWQPLSTAAPSFGPSSLQIRGNEKAASTREMTKHEIGSMLGALRQSVGNMQEAGFDGVMVHAAHGALAEQFLSPYFNHRTDEYGGCLENRMRFLIESLQVTRAAAGPRMAVGMRFNCDELLVGGYDSAEARRILATVCDSGLIDFVDLDVAVEPQQYFLGMPSVFIKPHVYRPYVEAVRGAAGRIPVLSVIGRMTSVEDAEAVIAAGVCDMVGAARSLIAEPDLVRNAYDGNEERSRTCIACNWCMAGISESSAGCAINPASYRERLWGADARSSAPRRCKVIVVGGGPGGLEASRVSALRGHDVTLFEKRSTLGGAFSEWAALPGREAYRTAIDWWEREIIRLGVTILRGATATAGEILQERPDAVILATGAVYSRGGRGYYSELDISGSDQDFVFEPAGLFSLPQLPTGKVVVLDDEGIQTGMGIAELLAKNGADVEFLTPNLLPVSGRLMASQDGRPMIERFRAAGGKISTMSYIKHIGDHEVLVKDVFSEEVRSIADVSAVILTTSRIPLNELDQELEGRVSQLFTIGDALAPRMWAASTFEAHKFARLIGVPDAPCSIADAYFSGDDPTVIPIAADASRR